MSAQVPDWLYASREEFARETGIPGPLLAKALSPEQVGDLTAVQEAKIRAALAVIAGEIRAAADHVVEDVVKRAVWLSDDTFPTVMSWMEAHRVHGKEPYIGCPFCQEQFVPRAEVERLRAVLEPVARIRTGPYAWMGGQAREVLNREEVQR